MHLADEADLVDEEGGEEDLVADLVEDLVVDAVVAEVVAEVDPLVVVVRFSENFFFEAESHFAV